MKTHLLAVMLMAAGLMMTACGNGNNNQKNDQTPNQTPNQAPNQTSVVDENKTVEEPVVMETSGINAIKKVWANNSFDLDAGDQTPNIETYALAFCKTYPQFEINKTLADYLINGTYDKSEYEIINDKKNGYIRCMWLMQYTDNTDVCYWNRKDGTQLVAVYMESNSESDPTENLVTFYSYDHAEGVMTPEPALTQMIEERMKKYDSYSVVLPREGKDIQVIGYIVDEENDSADRNELKLKWDGQNFNWEN